MPKKILYLYKNCKIKDKVIAYLRYKFIPLRHIEKYIINKEVILDLGCGQGVCSNAISIKYPNLKIIGFDFDSKKIKISKNTIKKRKNIEFYYADVTNLDFKKYKPSTILLVDTLSTIPKEKHNKLFENCYKALQNNGLLIIKGIDISPKIKYFLNYVQSLIIYRILRISKGKKFYYYDSKSLKSLLENIGFQVELQRLDKWKYIPHFLCVAKKK